MKNSHQPPQPDEQPPLRDSGFAQKVSDRFDTDADKTRPGDTARESVFRPGRPAFKAPDLSRFEPEAFPWYLDTPPPRRRRGRLLAIVVAVLVLACAGVLVFVLWPGWRHLPDIERTVPDLAAPPVPPIEPLKQAAQLEPVAPAQTAIVPAPVAPSEPVAPADIVAWPDMVSLSGDAFVMGSKDDRSEEPLHVAVVGPFQIGRFLVTAREWNICEAHKGCDLVIDGPADQPAANLSWADAQQYLQWLSTTLGIEYRLPTEAEWEYAARGGTSTRYWWGEAIVAGKAACKGCLPQVANQVSPGVFDYPPNPFGLYGLVGFVAQWVSDCWHKDYRGAPADGSSWNASNCQQRVLRGGSWRDDSTYLRLSSRQFYDSSVRYPTHGFRVARSQ